MNCPHNLREDWSRGQPVDHVPATLRWHLVSRHPGALAWLQRHARPGPVFVHTHLDRLEFDAGDIVCGVLPVHLMARINQLGARVAVIEMDVPADLRGRELSPEELDAGRGRTAGRVPRNSAGRTGAGRCR